MIFVQFGVNKHYRLQKFFFVFEKFTHAYQHQIAIKIALLPTQILVINFYQNDSVLS